MSSKLKKEKLRLQSEYCKEGTILDIGFAANPNIFLKNAAGLDIILPKNTPINYKQTFMCNLNREKMPIIDNSFDNIIAGDVIEHLENPSFFLREVNRVLKNEGRLILSTPQASDWWVILHNWFFRGVIGDSDPGEHLSNWTFLDMTRLLKRNGFMIEKIDGFYMHFPKIKFQIRVRRFPALSWQVFYVVKKVGIPEESVLVCVDGIWRKV